MKQICLGVVIAAGLTLPAFGQQAVNPDGHLAAHINLAKSTVRGPSVKSQTLSYSGDGFTATGFGFDGKPFTIGAAVIADGKSHPMAGAANYDATTYTQIDPYTISISRTRRYGDHAKQLALLREM